VFTQLFPASDLQNPTATSDRLGKKSATFLRTPILESECSQVLRLANVKHIIFDVICDNLWQPFLSEYLWECLGARRVVTDIYSRLAADGNQVQRNWKVSILRMLDQLDETLDSSPLLDFLTGEVLEKLRPLLDDRQVVLCQADLRQLFIKSIKLDKAAERNQPPIQISRNPSLSDMDGWLEFSDGVYETSPPSTPVEPQSALYVTPKVYHLATEETLEVVICAGSALFPKTGIFQQGLAEWQRVRKKTVFDFY
jgi:hypothetical protein